jgi:hypothetical protein
MSAKPENRRGNDRAARIYRLLKGARDLDDDERWQHALFFAMSPEERCQFSIKAARLMLSLKRPKEKAIISKPAAAREK